MHWLYRLCAAAMCCFVSRPDCHPAPDNRQAPAKGKRKRLPAKEAAVSPTGRWNWLPRKRPAQESNQFFSNISHDMRTPLNAVIGFAGLAENAPDIKKKNEYLSKIKSSGPTSQLPD
jgi:hypothetical protein